MGQWKFNALMVLGMCLTIGATWAVMSEFTPAHAQEAAVPAVAPAAANPEIVAKVEEQRSQGEYGLLAVGVGLSILGGAIGTGLAQKGIGHAVVAACAENRSFLGLGIFLLALPETILIIATGLGYLLLQKIS